MLSDRRLPHRLLDRPHQHVLGRFLGLPIALASALFGCSFPSGEEIFPPANDPAMLLQGVTLSSPIEALQPVNTAITLTFSDIIDPDTGSLVAIRLGGRGSPIETLPEYNLVERKLILRPKASLVSEAEYQIDVGTSIKSLAGVAIDRPTRVTFRTGRDVLPNPPMEVLLTLADMIGTKGQLKAFCAASGCHAVQAVGEVAARNLDLSTKSPALRSYLVNNTAVGSPQPLRLV